MATQSIIIAHPKTIEQKNALSAFMEALKIQFEVADKSPYNSEFVSKLRKSKQEIEEGNTKTVKKEDLKKLLGLS